MKLCEALNLSFAAFFNSTSLKVLALHPLALQEESHVFCKLLLYSAWLPSFFFFLFFYFWFPPLCFCFFIGGLEVLFSPPPPTPPPLSFVLGLTRYSRLIEGISDELSVVLGRESDFLAALWSLEQPLMVAQGSIWQSFMRKRMETHRLSIFRRQITTDP